LHKQKYWKKENLKIKKDKFTEINGNREELEPLLGEVIECNVFVTNTIKYNGLKRLITEVKIPGTNFYISHLWVQEYKVPLNKVFHGYKAIKFKVIKYKDIVKGDTKYGLNVKDDRIKVPKAVIKKPKWMKEG